jgi:LPS export ABC transporter protein LptC
MTNLEIGSTAKKLNLLDIIKDKTFHFLLFAFISVPSRPPDILIRGFHLEETKDKKKTLQIHAPEAQQFKKEQILKALSPQTIFFQNDEKELHLNSNEIYTSLETRNIFFKGPTELKSPEGFYIKGENLRYLHKNKKILSEDFLRFESTPDLKQTFIEGSGEGLEADLNQKIFFISKNVAFSFLSKDSSGSLSKIKGDSVRIFREKGLAEVEGNVGFQNKDISLRSDLLSISFDAHGKKTNEIAKFQSSSRVIAFFDNFKLSSKEITLTLKNRKTISTIEANGEVVLSSDKGLEATTQSLKIVNPEEKNRKISFMGNVFLKQGTDEAKCREASIDPASDNWTLKGDASFQRGKDILSGEEIHYSKTNNILEVKKASGQLQKSHAFGTKK